MKTHSVLLLFAVVAGLFAPSMATAQTDSTWNAADGNWSDESNWTNGVPNGPYNAILSAGTRDVFQDIFGLSIDGLVLDDELANLILDNETTVDNSFEWNAGTISGSQALSVMGFGSIHSGVLDTTINNFGITRFQANSSLAGNGSSSVWNNKDGAITDFNGDGVITGSGLFNNEGGALLRKMNGYGETRIDWDVNSGGFIDVKIGTLALEGSHLFLNGMINTEGGGTFRTGANSQTILGPNAQASGEGTIILGGPTTINHSFTSGAILEFTADTVIDGSGTMNLNAPVNWFYGELGGSGVTNLNETALLWGAQVYRTVNNNGAGVIVTGNAVYGNSDTVWNNHNSAIFKITGDEHLLGHGQFNNLDTAFLKKTGGLGQSRIEWDVFHEGNMIFVEKGELSFQGNSYINGQMMVREVASIDFNGQATFGPNAYHTDLGQFKISGGTATFDYVFNSELASTFSGNASIRGAGILNMNKHLNWNGATLEGAGVTNLNSSSSITGGVLKRVVNNFGDATLTGAIAGDGGFWNNKSGATLTLGPGASFSQAGNLVNQQGGLVRQQSGSVSDIQWNFQNDGRIEIEAQAQILFLSDFTQSSTGELSLAGGVADMFGTSNFDGRISGNGSILGSSSGILVNGILSPGNSLGMLEFGGNLTLTSDSILDFDLGADFASDLISVIGGTLTLDGRLDLTMLDGASAGIYTLLTYNNSINDLGLELGPMPHGFDGIIFHDPNSHSVKLQLIGTGVPEPGSLLLLSSALFGLICRRRPRR